MTAAATPAPRRRPRHGLRTLGWPLLAMVLGVALLIGVTGTRPPRTAEDRARALAASVACPVCDGQSVAESDSEAAKGIRNQITTRISEGETDAQIRDDLAAAYGEHILLTPGRTGVESLVWTLPVVALIAALAGLVLTFRRWRRAGGARATDADRELVAAARLSDGYEDRP
jgi:cytochrome c-type biogenesis protein CcmH